MKLSEVLKIAKNECGYLEKASNKDLDDPKANPGKGNFTKYARDLAAAGYYNGNKNGYDWCDVFVDWVFWQACGRDKAAAEEATCQIGAYALYGAGVKWSKDGFLSVGRLDQTPKVGDQFFIYNNITEYWEHTGIVTEVGSDYFRTIEGNTDNQVMPRYRSLSMATRNYYFGHPYYEVDYVDCSQWAKESCEWAVLESLFIGDDTGDYQWREPITREQVAVVLKRFHDKYL